MAEEPEFFETPEAEPFDNATVRPPARPPRRPG